MYHGASPCVTVHVGRGGGGVLFSTISNFCGESYNRKTKNGAFHLNHPSPKSRHPFGAPTVLPISSMYHRRGGGRIGGLAGFEQLGGNCGNLRDCGKIAVSTKIESTTMDGPLRCVWRSPGLSKPIGFPEECITGSTHPLRPNDPPE